MPSNNSKKRRGERKIAANRRYIAARRSGKTVAQREAERGYPARLNKETNDGQI